MKTEQLLPKNIRQIGSPVGHTKVYIEDYVITFLNSLSMDKNTYVRGAILFGEKKTIEDDTIIYVKGAIEGQNLELDLDETVFNDEVWREIYQQKDRLFPGLTILQNAEVAGTGGETWLERLGLGGELHARPDTLSGGMRRRVALARALCRDGDVFLMDEPFQGLDETRKRETMEIFRELKERKTILLITHDPEEASFLADRVVTL